MPSWKHGICVNAMIKGSFTQRYDKTYRQRYLSVFIFLPCKIKHGVKLRHSIRKCHEMSDLILNAITCIGDLMKGNNNQKYISQ